MEKEEKLFNEIGGKLVGENIDVEFGKMMSSPGITYKNKVFAFYYNRKMVFKLGKDFDIVAEGVEEYSLLSPFKTKPPLAAWFEIPTSGRNKWEELAGKALAIMSNEREKKK